MVGVYHGRGLGVSSSKQTKPAVTIAAQLAQPTPVIEQPRSLRSLANEHILEKKHIIKPQC